MLFSCGCDGGGDTKDDRLALLDPTLYEKYKGIVSVEVLPSVITGDEARDFTDVEHYTYRAYLPWSGGICVDPLFSGSVLDDYLLSLVTGTLYRVVSGEDGDARIVCEMAAEPPRDVTDEYVGRFGIETEGEARAFRIALNPACTFGMRDTVTAEDYVYSLFALLDPLMNYERAGDLTGGGLAIAGAKEYNNGIGDAEGVGVIAASPYELDIVLTESLASPGLMIAHLFSRPVLVEREIYEKSLVLIDENGDETASRKDAVRAESSYGREAKSFATYGPYFIAEYKAEDKLVLERNDGWYGYRDGKHRGAWQTDVIDITMSTRVGAYDYFLAGEYDTVTLEPKRLDGLIGSNRLVASSSDEVRYVTFDTDHDGNDPSSQLLMIREMRLAIAAAVTLADRNIAPMEGCSPFGEDITENYVRDMLTRAYELATGSGAYRAGDAVTLDIKVYGDDEGTLARELPRTLDRSADGTGFNDLIDVRVTECEGAPQSGDGIAVASVSRAELRRGGVVNIGDLDPDRQRVELSLDGVPYVATLAEWERWLGGEEIDAPADLGTPDSLPPNVREGFARAVIYARARAFADLILLDLMDYRMVSKRLDGGALRTVAPGLHDIERLTYKYSDEEWGLKAPTVNY